MSQHSGVTVYSPTSRKPLAVRAIGSLASLWHAFTRHREIWSFLATQDVKSRFRRSYLGVFWMVAHQLTFALGGGLLWASIFGLDPASFIPFLSAGFAIWAFIASGFVEGNNTFLSSQGYLRQVSMPLQIFIFRHLASSLIAFAIALVTTIGLAVLLSGPHVLLGLPYVLLGLFLLVSCILVVTATMAYVGMIFGDVAHAMTGIFQMLFVVSPVIYPPETLEQRGLGWFVHLNPFTSMLEIVRVPILEQTAAEPFYYLMVLAITLLFALCYALLDGSIGRRIVFYL